VVGNTVVKPKTGKLILFEGNEVKHEVLKVKSGTRYTNATWYLTQITEE
jgi:predicted 2-oxoglutarate/Fe(II)-dependent dioxygenase YbiX